MQQGLSHLQELHEHFKMLLILSKTYKKEKPM